jgi:O-methyltransferase involved in polyketide biosynthesis
VAEEPDAGKDALSRFNAHVPAVARAYDYLLGGKNNFPVDRELANKLIEAFPLIAVILRESRSFLGRAVAYVAEQGVDQFIDVGAGLPANPAVHEIAQVHNPNARVVYVDNDPMAVMHASALLAGDGVTAVDADMTDPAAVLAAATRLIDLDRPVCIILALVLHFFSVEDATRIVRGLTETLAPGSYLIISVGLTEDVEQADQFTQTYTAASVSLPTREQALTYFDGFELIEPGLTDARKWHTEYIPDERQGMVGVGVGRVIRR